MFHSWIGRRARAGVLDSRSAHSRRGVCSSAPPCTHTRKTAARRWRWMLSWASWLPPFRAHSDRRRLLRPFFLLTEEVAEALYDVKGHRHEKDSDDRGCEHAPDDHRSQHLARDRAC